ncbi:MAG: Slp family lipoprotein [Gammaproteobacteria bacterium]|nr:MAG: Slp family lipoprotein [Gammaproteobacteria bacterium]
MKTITLLITGLLLVACASKPPEAISKVPQDNPSLTRVRMDIDAYIGAEVRWGGEISQVENKADRTWIEIVRQDLRKNGRPVTGGKSDGRFIASFDRFLDPVVYEVGRPLTVVGTIESRVNRAIGDYDYQFPVVVVEGSFLWKKREPLPPPAYPPPWWYYDPWYHPYHHRHY